jgi:hypothetical protein
MTISKAAHTVSQAPDDGWKNCPKHVGRSFIEKTPLEMHGSMNVKKCKSHVIR